MADPVKQFVEVTKSSEEEAHQYLNQANGDLEVSFHFFRIMETYSFVDGGR